jgi:transcriptional regulator with XRE-family HTH domain
MTPDELLRRYPRETLRWLRGRLRQSQEAFGLDVGISTQTVRYWERRRYAISPPNRERLAGLLAPHLATPEGEAFMQSLGLDGEG